MTTASPTSTDGLATGVARGALWNGVTFALSRGLLLLTTIVLVRILPPEDFGLLALGLLVVTYLDVLGDLGLGAAVIYRTETSSKDTSTAVLLAACTGAILTVAAVLCAPLVAAAFDEPRLTAVVQLLSLGFLVRMLGIVQQSKLVKELDFRRRLMPEAVGALVKGGLAIGLALGGAGVWSLVWGQITGLTVATTLYWLVARWRFTWTFDRRVARELLRFGLPVTLLGGLSAVLHTIGALVVGQRLGVVALGIYTVAFRLPELIVMQLCYVLSGALFPAYTKARGDLGQLRSAFRSTLRLVSVITTPLSLGLALVAPELVPILFGERWLAAVPVMQVLAIYCLAYSLSFNVGDVYKATGRPGVLVRLGCLRLAVTAPVLWVVAPGGILDVAYALAGVVAAMTVVQLVVAGRVMDAPLRAVLAEFWPAAAAGAVMVIVTVAVRLLALDSAPDPVRLSVTVVVAALSYLATLAVVSRKTLEMLLGLLRRALSRRHAPAVAPG